MKKLNKTIIIFLIVTSLHSGQSKTQLLDSLFSFAYDNNIFNGNVLIAENRKIILNKSYGYADFEKKQKLNQESKFYLASVSKQFTATAIMFLKEKNLLDYSDSIKKYLPELPECMNGVTIRHLLTHTSGIPDYYNFTTPAPGFSNKDVYNIILSIDSLNFKPGDKYSYSNSGYILLALIAERVSKKSFRNFMLYDIFSTVDLFNTDIYDDSKPKFYGRVKGYTKDGEPNDYQFLTYGAGGFFSTTEDLFIWDQQLYRNRPVFENTFKEGVRKTLLNDSTYSNYGFGWMIDESGDIIYHTGSLAGFRTYFERNLADKNTIILLTNKECNKLKELGGIARKILKNESIAFPTIESIAN